MTRKEGKITIDKSGARGYADHGWLKTRHTFSFASYYNPDRIQFGVLRVLNDDIVSQGMGFGTHPHDNMEIISIPLEGSLAHKDNTGSEQVIKTGEVQIMSAGTGLTHSEYNYSKTEHVNFIQIWIFPKKRNIKPRYDQKNFHWNLTCPSFLTVVAPDDPNALWINQDAWLSICTLKSGSTSSYTIKKDGNGLYAFLIKGAAVIENTELNERDGAAIEGIDQVNIRATKDTKILLIDIPMQL